MMELNTTFWKAANWRFPNKGIVEFHHMTSSLKQMMTLYWVTYTLKKQQGIFPLLVHFLPFHDKYSSSKNVNEFRRNFTVLHYLTLECDLI